MAAAARTMLLAAAANRWQVDAGECSARDGMVHGPRAGQRLEYGALTTEAARLEAPANPPLLPRARWQHIGTSKPRHDLGLIVRGARAYGIDTHFDGMLYAAVATSNAKDAVPAASDDSAVKALPGVQHVLRLEDAVAVIADSWHRANKALTALGPRWDRTGPPHETALARVAPASARSTPPGTTGDVTFEYVVPLLTQMALEPVNATVRVDAGRIDLWLSTQTARRVVNQVAQATSRPSQQVHVHVQPSGGGFGRRLQTDYVVRAVQIAAAVPGQHVKVLWPREQDTAASHPRPAARARATLTAPTADAVDFELDVLGKNAPHDGLESPIYRALDVRVHSQPVDTSLRTGPWRSVAYSQNLFFLEAFVNDAARLRQEDPLRLRRHWLGRHPRAHAVLDAIEGEWVAASRRADAAAGRGCGLALAECFGAVIAVMVQVRLATPGAFSVEHMLAVADIGLAINPDGARAQITGGLLQALSAAALEGLEVDATGIVAANFDRYPLLRLPQSPKVEVRLLETDADAPQGVGEIGVPALAPALVAAIASAGGPQVRSLPLSRQGLMLA
jgi:isoquinoline 1-oxidoreductase beta subunit